MSIDKYLSKPYNKRTYNCAHFASEVWEDLTGENLADVLLGVMKPRDLRDVKFKNFKRLKKVTTPISPCIVWLYNKNASHIGVFVDGRLLHNSSHGVRFELLETATLGYKKVSFYVL